MTIEGVIKCLPELIKLIEIKDRVKQRKIILNCQSCIIYAISEIIKNILNGNIPISTTEKKKLIKYKTALRKLATTKVSLPERRRVVNQVGGALPALLIPAISLLGSLIANKI